jgi:hypothetical protein
VNDQPVGETGPTIVAGSVTVEAIATDQQSGVSFVSFLVDGFPVAPSEVTRAGDRFMFTYRPGSPGNHTISVQATNGSGLTSIAETSLFAVPTPV